MQDASHIQKRFKITQHEDAYWCSSQGKMLALALGFDDQAAAGVAIAISELVSNVVKFAGEGLLTLTPLGDPRPGLEIRMSDSGPGIESFSDALRDGFSEGRFLSDSDLVGAPRRGLGAGLGAVSRFMHELNAHHPPGGGLVVVARIYL